MLRELFKKILKESDEKERKAGYDYAAGVLLKCQSQFPQTQFDLEDEMHWSTYNIPFEEGMSEAISDFNKLINRSK